MCERIDLNIETSVPYTKHKVDRWIALWVATKTAEFRAMHSYWPNQTKEILIAADKIYDWLQGKEVFDIEGIDDKETPPEEL